MSLKKYHVEIKDKSGCRLIHNHIFFGCEVEEIEEYGIPYFVDVRKKAKDDVERLRSQIIAAGKINPDHWIEAEPVYSSECYCKKYNF